MPDLTSIIADNLAVVIIVLAGLLLLVLVLVFVLMRRLARVTTRYDQLVQGTAGGSLQEVLDAHIGRVGEVSRQLDQLAQRYRGLEDQAQGTLQHIGMVRFNPFDDTGSDQSFAIALLDNRRDGIVISSLHGRNATRVFAKPVEGGMSRHSLSEEEAQAIQIAVEGTQAIAASS